MAFNHRILLQVTLPAVLIGLALIATCVIGINSLNRLQESRVRTVSNDLSSLQAAQEIEVRLRQLRFHSFIHLLDPSPLRRGLIEDDHSQFETALAKARLAAVQEDENRLIHLIDDEYRKYRTEVADENQRPALPPNLGALLAWADAHPVKKLLEPCDELLRVNQASIQAMTEESERLTAQSRRAIMILGIIGALGGVIGGLGMAWGLSRSYTRLQLTIQDTHHQLDREIGSVQIAVAGDLRELDRQMQVISHRVKAVMEETQQQQDKLRSAEQMASVGLLAAGVAHEVRNPLTGIKFLIESNLENTSSSGLSSDELRMILSEIHRVERTVQGLLDFARPFETQRHVVDIRALMRETVDTLRPRAEKQETNLESSSPEHPVLLSVDSDQFVSLLTNLVINALEATAHGKSVGVDLSCPDGDTIQLCVTDSGPGIAPGFTGKLFQAFATTKGTGTGLGLAVARRVAENHGGTLTAWNLPQGGACFRLTLPARGV